MVTHDFVEANYLAEKVAIINEGEVIEQGLSEKVFQKPNSIFAARFIGIKNIFWIEDPEELSFFGLQKPAHIGIRPENIYISQEPISTDYSFMGTVGDIKNNQIFMEVNCCDSKRDYSAYLTVNYFFKLKLKKGQPIHFGFNKDYLIQF